MDSDTVRILKYDKISIYIYRKKHIFIIYNMYFVLVNKQFLIYNLYIIYLKEISF